MSTVDPYTVVGDVLTAINTAELTGPVSGRQMSEAAALAAGMLAALGVEPAVAGDTDHQTVRRGRWLLQLLRRRDLPEGGGFRDE